MLLGGCVGYVGSNKENLTHFPGREEGGAPGVYFIWTDISFGGLGLRFVNVFTAAAYNANQY